MGPLERKSLFAGIIVTLLLLSITSYIVYNRYLYYKTLEQKAVATTAFNAKISLESCLSRAASKARTLAFIVENYGKPENFEKLAAGMLQNENVVSAIQILDSGVVANVYPADPNSRALGYDILKDPARREDALKAIEKRDVYFAGPLMLKQGGIGVIGRMPIFKEGKFIGFAATIIKFQDLISVANIQNSPESAFEYELIKPGAALSKTEPESKNEAIIAVPVGEWHVKVRSKSPLTLFSLSYTIILGVILSVIAGMLVTHFIRLPQRLRQQVRETRRAFRKKEIEQHNLLHELRERNKQLKEVMAVNALAVRSILARILELTNHLERNKTLSDHEKKLVNSLKRSSEEFHSVALSLEKNHVDD